MSGACLARCERACGRTTSGQVDRRAERLRASGRSAAVGALEAGAQPEERRACGRGGCEWQRGASEGGVGFGAAVGALELCVHVRWMTSLGSARFERPRAPLLAARADLWSALARSRPLDDFARRKRRRSRRAQRGRSEAELERSHPARCRRLSTAQAAARRRGRSPAANAPLHCARRLSPPLAAGNSGSLTEGRSVWSFEGGAQRLGRLRRAKSVSSASSERRGD